MLGNALEWCQERVLYYNTDLLMNNDKEDIRDISSTQVRVLRGGSFVDQPMLVRSAYRFRYVPADRGFNAGFRPARTFR
jgi:formylglycine-generating enzyme required for sulfatase activity